MSKITVPDLLKKKHDGKKITMVTAYDFPFGQIVDEAGIDVILIGDSLGVVVQGKNNTLSVTMEEMVYHTRMVARAAERALVVGDMPFMSFQPGIDDAVRNACRFLQAGATAVKLEGGEAVGRKRRTREPLSAFADRARQLRVLEPTEARADVGFRVARYAQ